MTRQPERATATSVEAALAALGVAPGTSALLVPGELAAESLGLTPAPPGAPVSLALLDAERVELAAALPSLAPQLGPGALVVVRARVRGEGALGSLRGRRVLEDVVEPLFTLPIASLGVVEVSGLFGATLAWARVLPDAH